MHADGGAGAIPQRQVAGTANAEVAAGSGFVLLVLAGGQFLMTLDSSVAAGSRSAAEREPAASGTGSRRTPAEEPGFHRRQPARATGPPGGPARLPAQLDVLLISFDAVRDRAGPANRLKLG